MEIVLLYKQITAPVPIGFLKTAKVLNALKPFPLGFAAFFDFNMYGNGGNVNDLRQISAILSYVPFV